MASYRRRKRNVIPINVVQKRGQKHRISKELVNLTIQHTSSPPALSETHDETGRADTGRADTDPCDQGLYISDYVDPADPVPAENLTEHTKRQFKLSEKCKGCILSAFKAVVEGESMKDDVECTNCGAQANVRCRQCGPYIFFCSDCGIRFHSQWNYHHYPEMWKVHC